MGQVPALGDIIRYRPHYGRRLRTAKVVGECIPRGTGCSVWDETKGCFAFIAPDQVVEIRGPRKGECDD